MTIASATSATFFLANTHLCATSPMPLARRASPKRPQSVPGIAAHKTARSSSKYGGSESPQPPVTAPTDHSEWSVVLRRHDAGQLVLFNPGCLKVVVRSLHAAQPPFPEHTQLGSTQSGIRRIEHSETCETSINSPPVLCGMCGQRIERLAQQPIRRLPLARTTDTHTEIASEACSNTDVAFDTMSHAGTQVADFEYDTADAETDYQDSNYFHLLSLTRPGPNLILSERAGSRPRRHSSGAMIQYKNSRSTPMNWSSNADSQDSPLDAEVLPEDATDLHPGYNSNDLVENRQQHGRSLEGTGNAMLPLQPLVSIRSLPAPLPDPFDSAFASAADQPANTKRTESVHGVKSDILEPLDKNSFNQGYYDRFFVEEKKLGRGQRGSVFLCQHVLDKVALGAFAVKAIPVGTSHVWLARMLKEVRLLERLRHPNIIEYRHAWLECRQLTRFGPEVPCLFILMELANGGNLEEYIRIQWNPEEETAGQNLAQIKSSFKANLAARRSRLAPSITKTNTSGGRLISRQVYSSAGLNLATNKPTWPPPSLSSRQNDLGKHNDAAISGGIGIGPEGRIVRFLTREAIKSLFSDICNGLSHLHRHGIIHRDIKPPNLLLRFDQPGRTSIPRILISDFGECEVIADDIERERTGATGTLEFMPPELLRKDAAGRYILNHSPKADIWSLGMVLYFLCFSSLPYSQADDIDLLKEEILGFDRVTIPTYGDRVPETLVELIQVLLKKNPDARPTADEVIIMANARPEENSPKKPPQSGDDLKDAQDDVLASEPISTQDCRSPNMLMIQKGDADEVSRIFGPDLEPNQLLLGDREDDDHKDSASSGDGAQTPLISRHSGHKQIKLDSNDPQIWKPSPTAAGMWMALKTFFILVLFPVPEWTSVTPFGLGVALALADLYLIELQQTRFLILMQLVFLAIIVTMYLYSVRLDP